MAGAAKRKSISNSIVVGDLEVWGL